MSLVSTLLDLGLINENGELDPNAVRDVCEAFVDAYTSICLQCLAEDPEFWVLTPEQRIIHIIAYALSLYMKRSVSPVAVATVVRVTKEAVEACREVFEEAGLRW
jgi:hypothetical protein